ncbi:unnamed protein product [Oncorhynchus mykiss]|uniref:Uncharacterized protein n=1 Tax=Oncorhynchus mykiss TaxID=8022 RepID=A0A060XY41_ONCMY|nr:unnamed protein product [Oncorhynchus mykiss]
MCNKQRGECRPAEEAGAGMPGLGRRTSVVLLLALLVAMVQGQVEVMGDMLQDGPGKLEASMHSSILSDFQEVEALEPVAATVYQAEVGAAGGESGIPDSSAVVGRVFQMKVPLKTDHTSNTKVCVCVCVCGACSILKCNSMAFLPILNTCETFL